MIPKNKYRPHDQNIKYSVTPPKNYQDKEFWDNTAKYSFIYSMAALVTSFVLMVGGMILIYLGVEGSITWISDIFGATNKLYNASPGVVLFLCGLIIILFTRFRVKASTK